MRSHDRAQVREVAALRRPYVVVHLRTFDFTPQSVSKSSGGCGPDGFTDRTSTERFAIRANPRASARNIQPGHRRGNGIERPANFARGLWLEVPHIQVRRSAEQIHQDARPSSADSTSILASTRQQVRRQATCYRQAAPHVVGTGDGRSAATISEE